MPGFGEALRFWFWLGCVSFGGPAGQIALMQQELVDKRRWIDNTRFLHGLNFAMLLPGPEAQQLATYVGWRLHGTPGGLVAGGLFVLPGALVLLGLSWLAAEHGDLAWVAALFDGVKPVVIAIIAASVWRLGRRTLKGPAPLMLALIAFLGLYLGHLPFPVLIAGAALIGYLAAKAGKPLFAPAGHGVTDDFVPDDRPADRSAKRLLRLSLLFAALLLVPVVAIVLLLGRQPWADIADLFTTSAFVTFGGAYAVLPFIAERAVETYHWLTPADMVNGLALAESTPGPLILVTQYVGFFAGWNHPGGLSPLAAGITGAVLTTYVTFLPCFFFIFAGAPYVEALIHNRAAAGALAAITAAVVGVILNLGVVLGEAVILPGGRVDWVALLVAAIALIAMLRFKLAVHWLVLAGAAFGLLRMAVG
ncbi:chromate efflux transporter [Niveispirillum sp.]|uniref:chromate efflux transporter n=1 Tax=Niveispirillum sp. TaxID=1917217 RepID=UPI001B5CAAFA|nr:chromate efflux transporter [Niveispirillum sp.]MBP7336520.1 chromate efflux transporter [Niveispirillum sp.]